FDVEQDADGMGVTFSLELPGHGLIRKRFRLDPNPHVLDARIEFTNRREEPQVMGMDAVPAYLFFWGPDLRRAPNSDRFVTRELIWRVEREGLGENLTAEAGELPLLGPGNLLSGRLPNVHWIGFKDKYFLVAMRPEGEQGDAYALGQGNGEFLFGYAAPRFQAEPGETVAHDYRLYIGPMELASLEKAWDTLPTALTFFTMFDIMDWFAKFLLGVLHWFYENTVANYGVAIILMTVCIRLVLLPLTLKSMKSMKKMQALGPEMKELQEKYKDDQQELSKKTMQLYRERGVNPVGGCLPVLLQMPIFIALYRMLWYAYEMRGAEFLWIEDLSQPDRLIPLPFLENVPFVGQYLGYLNVLPILMAGAMILNMKVMPAPGPMQRPEQKMVMNLMPIIFAVFCYPLAAGLNLYVLTSTVLGIGQSWLVRHVPTHETSEPVKKEPKKKRGQDFYSRAQERQHEMRKEARKARRNKQKGRGKSGAKP
ncbi:MAG: YidC/Oxa1 family insertase periplasmic-domain containing protein, partial [Candidatus Hydrogenedentales bacterium]